MSSTRDVGWYRDPAHPDRHRFWDGRRWQSQSEHVSAPARSDADPAPLRDLQHLTHRRERADE